MCVGGVVCSGVSRSGVSRSGVSPVVVGACPPYPAGAPELVLAVSQVESWPLPTGASTAEAAAFLRDRPVLECVAARSFGALVGLSLLYRVAPRDLSYRAWVDASGLPPEGLRAVGSLLVAPSFRGAGVGRAVMLASVDRVRSGGFVPVAATRLEVPSHVLTECGVVCVGTTRDAAGGLVRLLVGSEAPGV